MFQNLSERLTSAVNKLRGLGRITESNIQDTLREVRLALLEADVALPVVKSMMEQVQEQAIGQAVIHSLTPGQVLIKIVYDELVNVMGKYNDELTLNVQPPAVILMAGLQGSGKTTTAAKLALLLKETTQKKVMLVSTDVYRPAAIEQLRKLAEEINVYFYPSSPTENPLEIANHAINQAKLKFLDVLIVDTAGRLHIDENMMTEMKQLHAAVHPAETLFVVDSMTGQDAAKTAKVFNDALPLTGIILTKTDGDARGGAALSIRQITGKPLKFLGTGEKIDALEAFYPERMASRILGMGDILSLVEEAERKVDIAKAKKMAQKFRKGKTFDLEDFLQHLQEMKKMGGITKLLDKLPNLGPLQKIANSPINEAALGRFEAIINSMTPQERRYPLVIKGSRKLRISKGSGTKVQDVNYLLKQFEQMQKMMKKYAKGGLNKMMQRMKSMLPP